ncbi:MAG: adenylate/guanylate cyclase domain-containing protein [Pseudomonadota bacterium]
MTELWRGDWTTRLRIASGLILMLYAAAHFLNTAAGIHSGAAMQAVQDARLVITRSMPGSALLYGALALHTGLALARLIRRRSLKMPTAEALQYVLGFTIPLLLATHIIYTRGSHEQFATNDSMAYIVHLIWGTSDGWLQAALLLIVWGHGCIGLHHWLRGQGWYRRAAPILLGAAVIVPTLALAGFQAEGQRLARALAAPDQRSAHFEATNFPSADAFGALAMMDRTALYVYLGLLAGAVLIQLMRRVAAAQASVSIVYEDGPQISAPRGMTLLEMSRNAGVAHTALCGGKGRCTTCRVRIHAGAHTLPEPDTAEARSLKAVGAAPGQRLACQLRPEAPITVSRVFLPGQGKARAHASQGTERALAILFLDMRGFTARTAGQLPYDVVFLLNRFFDAIVPAITGAGGTVDKYLGDGLLAVFETEDTQSSARAGLAAARAIGDSLRRFNAGLMAEGGAPVGIGIGLHLGDVVLGEIGAQGNAPRTLIGDAVNTASRLEGQTKPLGVELIASATVLEAAGLDIGDLELVTLELRGVAEPLDALPVARAAAAPAPA